MTTVKQRSTKKKNSKKVSIWWKDRTIQIFLLLILVLTTIAFFPALSNDLLNWDDDVYVKNNTLITSFSIDNLKGIFTTPISSNYHPITILSLSVNYLFSGTNPFGYHLTNVLLHLFNIILVFYFTYLISPSLKIQEPKIAGFLVALLFAIHPMHVESVAWVAERKDVLYTIFFMAGLIQYWQYLLHNKQQQYFFTLLLFVLAVLSKPTAVVFPFFLLLLDWLKHDFKEGWIKNLLSKTPFFSIALAMGIVTIIIQKSTGAINTESYTFSERIVFAGYGLSVYILKLFIPTTLSAFYPYPETVNGLPIIFYLFTILSLSFVLIAFISKKYTKVILFGFAFFLLPLILTLQVITVGDALLADRYTYIPYIGLAIIIAFGYDKLRQNFPKQQRLFQLFLGGYFLLFAFQTFQRCQVWKNSKILWTDVIEKYPEQVAEAYNNRGTYYRNQKQPEKALKDLNQAIILRPQDANSYSNRGNIFFDTKQYEKAIQDYNMALEKISQHTASDQIYSNRGSAYYYLNKTNEALQDYNKAIELKPTTAKHYANRAFAYKKLGDKVKAKQDIDKAKRLGMK